MNITHRDPREASLVQMKRYRSGDLESAGRHMRQGFEASKIARGVMKVVGVLAVTMVLADGLLVCHASIQSDQSLTRSRLLRSQFWVLSKALK